MTHISIIVVHYNHRAVTLRCLESLALVRTRGYKLTVLIVDNGSTKFFKLPKNLQSSKRFKVIRSDSNLGFTGGNNLGIHYAIEQYNSQFVCLLNNDTTVQKNFLSELYDLAKSNSMIGVIAPKIYFSKGKEFHRTSYSHKQKGNIIWFAGGAIDWLHLSSFHIGVDEVDIGQHENEHEIDFATGCCMFISRELLERIGLLDKRYFMYFEDLDFCLRAKHSGYSIMYCPRSIIWHDNAGSSGGSGSSFQIYYQERNRSLMTFLHGSTRAKLTALRIQLSNLLSDSYLRRKAVSDFYLRRFGKQVLL